MTAPSLSSLELLRARRDEIASIVTRHHGESCAVFGSVATGRAKRTATSTSW